jgi:hypothetical protein
MKSANFLSSAGSSAFHRSLRAIGTMTSLNSGLPSRETCVKVPVPRSASSSRMRSFCRLADA